MSEWINTEPGKLVHSEASEMISITQSQSGIGYSLHINGAAIWFGTLQSAKADGVRKLGELREIGLL